MGYTEYILRVLKHCLLPNCGITSYYINSCGYIHIALFISLEKGLIGEYVIWSLETDDMDAESNMRIATSEEFIDFFKGCGPQEWM